MAGIALSAGVGRQVGLLAALRWRLFRNTLRTMTGRLEAVGGGVIAVSYAFFALGFGAAMGIGAYAAIQSQKPEILNALMWAVFLIWQLFSLFGTVTPFSARFDFSEFLRFPLRFSTFAFLSVAYGFFEPIALVAVFWLVCMGAGIAAAKPGMWGWAALVLTIFVLVNVLLNRAILSWLERWMAQRRTREVLAVVFVLLGMCAQFIFPLSTRWASRKWRFAHEFQPLTYALPPAWGGRALTAAVAGHAYQAACWLAALAASGILLAWLLAIRLKRQYRGEDLSETRVSTPAPRRRTGRRAWEFEQFSGPVAAVFQKEILYLLRNWPMLLGLFSPLLALLYFGFIGRGDSHAGLWGPSSDLLFPLVAAFATISLFASAYNCFGFDGPGVQLYFVAPIRFQDVLAGKNLAQAITLLAGIAVAWVGIALFLGPPAAAVVGTTLAGLAFVTLLTCAAGNPLSLCFPRRMQFGTLRAQRTSGMSGLASVGVQFFLLGITAGVYLLARHWGRLWLAAAMFLLLCVPAALAYRATIRLSNRVALNRRTVLTEELCRS